MSHLQDLFGIGGKNALVTGGDAGIGRMIAETLALAGARVLIASRRLEDADAAADEIAEKVRLARGDGAVEGLAGDLSTAKGVETLATETGLRVEALHVLVNNAGVSWNAPLENFPHEAWEKVTSVNLAGLFGLTRALLPKLEAAVTADDPARIVNIGAVAGLRPTADRAYSYAASKAGVHHLTRVFANELAPRRITCNALAPGVFKTRMTATATEDAERAAETAAAIPIGRLGRAEDVGAAALFLCGRGGAYVTGAILPVDGGLSVEAPTGFGPR